MATPKKVGAANTRASKPRGKGKPFEKGNTPANAFTANDPRANRSGQRSAQVVRFSKEIRAVIVAVGDEEVKANGVLLTRLEGAVRGLYQAATKGNVQAFNALVERVEGKVDQPVSGDISGTIEVILREVINENGNN